MIILTNPDGQKLYINPSQIEVILPTTRAGCEIVLISGRSHVVIEEPKTVLEKIYDYRAIEAIHA